MASKDEGISLNNPNSSSKSTDDKVRTNQAKAAKNHLGYGKSNKDSYRKYQHPNKNSCNLNHRESNLEYSGIEESNPGHSDDSIRRKARQKRFTSKPILPYGFVSRGEDDRLCKSEADRKSFFNEILESFIQYCDENSSLELSKYFEYLNANHESKESSTESNFSSSKHTIESILLSLRKLREALINLPCDEFTLKVFLFSVRIAANFGHYQTYIPSIMYLLTKKIPLQDQQEIATLLVLHTSHFNQDNSRAIAYLFKYVPDNIKLNQILSSWINKDYYNWIKLYNLENDNAKSSIMRFGLQTIMNNMIQCLTVSYYNLKLSDLIQLLPEGISFETLKHDYNISWNLDLDNVIIRTRKPK
jgi:hypothetical protein